MEDTEVDVVVKNDDDRSESKLCNEGETSNTNNAVDDPEPLNNSDTTKDKDLAPSADAKGSGKKGKKSKQNWKNRFSKQKQKGTTVQDVPENPLNRRPFHLNYKFRLGRKRAQSFPAASKFFLPYKRPRKETFIPPTKFLLGGNISDPLNLNSLQDEDVNRAMNAVTPKSSPLPTPPRHKAKIEVIIPPNIRDPLNLLNPLDNEEYEKQLEAKQHRRSNRKKGKSKRRSSECTNVPSGSPTQASPVKEESSAPTEVIPDVADATITCIETPSTSSTLPKDLKLDLNRSLKRTISESEGSKNKDNKKLRRMDSLDKIVSPVVPQPGSWMRVHTRGGGHAGRGGRGAQQGRPPVPRPHPAQAPAQPPAPLPKFRVAGTRYQYGNYDRYYGYRNLNAIIDIRLKVFGLNRHLFNNKDVLDIGCNVGHISIAIARDFGAKSVTGIDIDQTLIARARKNISNFIIVPPVIGSPAKEKITDDSINTSSNYERNATLESEADVNSDLPKMEVDIQTDAKADAEKSNTEGPSTSAAGITSDAKVDNNPPLPACRQTRRPNKRNRRSHHKQGQDAQKFYFPISCPILYGPAQVLGYPLDANSSVYPHNITFTQANYILRDENLINAEPSQYDLIMCLSVTKWFHLNWGDAGLKLAFKRMFAQLRPGGKLILEAQSWPSYKKKKTLTETIYKNFNTIEFFPNKFREYLLSPEVGFSKCCVLGVPQHLNKGFRRPIHLYIKGDFTPSKVQWSDTYAPSSHHRPETSNEGQPKKVYANVLSPSYHPSSSRWSDNNTPVYGAATPYSIHLETNSAEESPFYNPRSDSYLPSYTSSGQQKTVYASLTSPQSDYSGTPLHTPELSANQGIRGTVYTSMASPASPFLEPSPGNSTTPSHPFTPSHSASCDVQSNKKVYASLHSPQEEGVRGQPVYSPSVAGPSRRGAPCGHSPLHTGCTLSPLPELESTNSNDSLLTKGPAERATPSTSPYNEPPNSVEYTLDRQSPKETSNDAE